MTTIIAELRTGTGPARLFPRRVLHYPHSRHGAATNNRRLTGRTDVGRWRLDERASQAVTRTSPQRIIERIGQPSHHAGKAVAVMPKVRGRRWYATMVKNVLDRADVEQVKEAA